LLIPEKLYGRAGEVEALLTAFDRVVANELNMVLVPPRGLFAAGKFDQYKRDLPYATLAQAFQTATLGVAAVRGSHRMRTRAPRNGRSSTDRHQWTMETPRGAPYFY
jgi:hypothetical protein